MDKLTKIFQSGEVLKAQDLNTIKDKINELVEGANNESGGPIANELIVTDQQGFFIIDSNNNVALKYDSNGFDVAKLSVHFKSLLSTPQSSSKWSGKTINVLGDSITDFGQWTKAYKNISNCIYGHPADKSETSSWGKSGSTFASANVDSQDTIAARSLLMDDADLIILFAGTNDWGLSWAADLGNFTDQVTTTYCGALHLTFKRLLEKYPNTPIVVFLPLHRRDEIYDLKSDQPSTFSKNADGLTVNHRGKIFDEYCDIIRRIANHYSIKVIDIRGSSRMCPFNDDFTTWYNSDGIHLNDEGGRRLAEFIYPELEQVYDEFYSK